MKQYALIFLLWILCSSQSMSQTVHFLMFADTEEQEVKASSMESINYFRNTMIPNIRSYSGRDVIDRYFYGYSDYTKDKVASVINSLSSGGNDVIIFYYTGHGYNDGNGEYPCLTLGKDGTPIPPRAILLSSIYSTLSAKPHALLLVVAEACNVEYQTHPQNGRKGSSYPPMEINPSKMRQLFNQAGDYMACSSRRGQKSNNIMGDRGFFTAAFCAAINQVCSNSCSDSPTWESVFTRTKSATARSVEEAGFPNPQNPYWECRKKQSVLSVPSVGESAVSKYNAGVQYYNSHDYNNAIKYFKEAAQIGYADAQYWLGNCCDRGLGEYGRKTGYQNCQERNLWYQKAAEQGHAKAAYWLGYYYRTGNYNGFKIGKPDYNLAFKYYKIAADNGDRDAQREVGNCYEFGLGIEENQFRAVEWYKKAAIQGDGEAARALSRLGYN